MDTTFTRSTFSSETTPLLKQLSSDQSQTLRFPQTRTFSCAVIGITFVTFCTRLTLTSILWSLYLFGSDKEFLDLTSTKAFILGNIFTGTCNWFIFRECLDKESRGIDKWNKKRRKKRGELDGWKEGRNGRRIYGRIYPAGAKKVSSNWWKFSKEKSIILYKTHCLMRSNRANRMRPS